MLPGLCGIMAGLGRVPVELVASAVDTTNRSGSYTFAGLNFGDDFTGRTLVAVVGLAAAPDPGSGLNQTSVTIGGASASGDDTGDGAVTDVDGVAGTGVWSAQPSGTSGSVVVNFSSSAAKCCAVYLFAVAGLASAAAHASMSINSGVGTVGTASGSGTLNIPSNGVIIGGVTRAGSTNAITLSGMTKVFEQTIDSSHRIAVGYDFRMALEVGRSIGWSSTTRTGNGMRVSSYA